MNENRRLQRWQLTKYLHVYDQNDQSFIGYLIDIHTQGMQLASMKPIPPEKEYSLIIEVPKEDDLADDSIVLEACSLWNSEGVDPDPDFHFVGFKFMDPSDTDIKKIQEVVDRLY